MLDRQYRQIVNFRNKIIHEYFGIDPDEIWSVISDDLDSFEEVILNLINNIEINLKQELINSFIEDNCYLDFVVKRLEKVL